MKIIVVMPVKNEEWILEKSLKAASFFADHIIVGDQDSIDRTPEICKKFPKVTYLINSDEYPGTKNRRQILLDKARQLYGAGNIVFCLDADEIPTANILKEPSWKNLLATLKPGQSVMLEWINLWRSPRKYRNDKSVWTKSFRYFVFKDDGKTNYTLGNVHESRVPNAFSENSLKYKNVKIMHFHFVLWSRMLSKQRHCRLMEKRVFPKKSFLAINARYWTTKDERSIILKDTPKFWLRPWQEKGIDIENFLENDLYWFDAEILQDFKKYGTEHFKWLDIWDVDWEKKRQIAIKRGIKELPDNEIKDPRPFYIKFYHKYLQLLLGYDSFLYKIYRFLKRSRLSNLSRSFLTFKRK